MRIGLLTPSFTARRTYARGLTLTEVLIAVTITLVLMAVLVNAFRDISGQISESRAIIQLAGQLRGGAEQLRDDLRGVTLPVRPWVNPAEGQGYFEQAEYDIAVDNPDFTMQPDNIIGDVDDVMMFTCRSTGAPFRGRIRLANGTLLTIESPLAEIVIWTRLVEDPDPNIQGNTVGSLDRDLGEYITVHRRVLLIRPDLNDDIAVFPNVGQIAGNNDLLTWYQNNDVSVHVSATGLVANSLGDLSKREYRFAHTVATDANFVAGNINDIDASLFPYPINRTWLNALTLQGNFAGEDVLQPFVLGRPGEVVLKVPIDRPGDPLPPKREPSDLRFGERLLANDGDMLLTSASCKASIAVEEPTFVLDPYVFW